MTLSSHRGLYPAPAGGRISSPKLRESYTLGEEFSGLEENTNRYDLLVLVKRAGKYAGFSSKMIELLDYYMSYTRDVDWEQGARPIVYQSLSKTALDLGVSERQIQKLEKRLFEAGALTWNDSGNHRRFGQRCPKSGMILFAYGADLTPLAYLKGTLRQKLAEKKMYDDAWMETKRQISWYRRQIRAVLDEAGQGPEILAVWELKYQKIAHPIRTYMDLVALRELLNTHRQLHESVLTGQLESFSPHKAEKGVKDGSIMIHKNTPSDEQKFVHYNLTTQKQSDKSETNSPTVKGFQKSHSDFGGKSEGASESALKTGLQHITLKQVLNAASPRFRECIPIHLRPMSWHDVIEAAYTLKTLLGISQNAWAQACLVLGRTGAAICVLLVDQAALRPRNTIDKPAAYFNAMIKRAQSGDLRLHNSIFGLLRRGEGG